MTPTPWTLKQHAMNHQTLTGATAGLIADIHKDEDARLIAAAPDLLAALIELSDYVFDEFAASHPLCERAAEARAVIAKATGVQS
jgi:hypothetical protein